MLKKTQEQNTVKCIIEPLPNRWRQDRLLNVAELKTSNVNKKSVDGEQTVQLCNYVDVYYNGKITNKINFMKATASKNEIDKFSLEIDDVIITKDSESPDDIGVPAVVAEYIKDLVCGYHLTILRPIEDFINGRYLFYAVASRFSAYQCYLAANGVTRFGLTTQGTKNLVIAFPEKSEQQKIADFLDWKTSQIDTLIAKKKQLIEKLREKRMALITRAVTKGLDPGAPMRDSGIPWLGEVPEHWEIPQLKMRYKVELGKMLDDKRIVGTDLVEYLRNVDVQWDEINFENLPMMDISLEEYRRYTVKENDVLVCEGGEVGRAAIVEKLPGIIGFQKALHRLRAITPDESPRFIFYTLVWAAHTGVYSREGSSTIAHLTAEQLRRYRFPKPPISEQIKIASSLDSATGELRKMTEKIDTAITRLTEYRTALITAAATGKIDIQNVNIPNPEQPETENAS